MDLVDLVVKADVDVTRHAAAIVIAVIAETHDCSELCSELRLRRMKVVSSLFCSDILMEAEQLLFELLLDLMMVVQPKI